MPTSYHAGRQRCTERTTPESVTTAVTRVLADPSFTSAAHRLRDEIAALPSADQVTEQLIAAAS
ncbi:hypothetical protein [Streptomyces canus]|uniref:hypothetical protein n=1 Tax=Streptomyces canus TaxID=58343 RepID=UPI003CF700AE